MLHPPGLKRMLQTVDAGLAKHDHVYADCVDCDVRSKRQYSGRFSGGRRFLPSLKRAGVVDLMLPVANRRLRTPSKHILSAHDQASPAKPPSGCDE